MTADEKAARHRQWAANAIAEAMRVNSEADQETLMMIARLHLTIAQKAERSAARGMPGRRPSRKKAGKHLYAR
jgi:hypothetical protein